MSGAIAVTRIFKQLAGLFGLWFGLFFWAAAAQAQTATIDWATAGVTNLTAVPNPTVVTGSDRTTATVTYSSVVSGTGSFVPSYGGFLSYYTGTIGSAAQPLLLNFDNSQYDPNDKVTATFTLSQTVRNLSFTLTDIDNGAFADAIEVYYDNGSGVFVNAASTPSFWAAESAVTRTNNSTVNGWRGTANVETLSTNGDLQFNFGSTGVKRIRIVYFSYTGTGDPSGQFTGISDFTYSAPGADLSLTKSLVSDIPVQGGTATYRLTLTNSPSSLETATGITVRDNLPSGFTFDSSSGSGTFNSATGTWSIASLAPGASVSIDISGTVSSVSGTSVTNTAEVTASSVTDRDSIPNNGVTTEDDFASVSFTVANGRVAGTPPELVCPNGSTIFDWDSPSVSWTAGSTNNSYALASFGNIGFAISNTGTYVTAVEFGGTSPTLQSTFTGGLSPTERNLAVITNQTSQGGSATITISLPRGFEGLQFTIFDVDFASGQFADRVTVTGSLSGSSVTPVLTNGNSNYVSGNVAIGDAASDSDSGRGNLTVTFTHKIDTVTISYGNHTTAPADPGNQGIGLHDIEMCLPYTTVSVTKVSSVVSDPVNGSTNPKAIPGAVVEYLISVTNTGAEAADADSVSVTDDAPADAKMCLSTFGGGSGPIMFNAGTPSSGLSYSYLALDSAGDDLEFSSDGGASWSYVPSPDSDGCDANISNFRVKPGGSFAASATFSLRVRFVIE
ncbi:DUF11 domain-containing protein [Qipengyuania aurantiaca]|uniref:DUF11 domain-containing protein n=1 Tax=Qipengyuania aurantiaca TaxID=2867233 RepID=A0ABX8ZP31_9SPHN|nr:DUF11 domain-containing protein [Qipengyuania aurantiaca]QZD88938.1 DUF11 domain-containing protein [Qipengyuania aurantiaca]